MAKNDFLPDDFVVPLKLKTVDFRIRPLTINDVVKDYSAVMTSIPRIRGVLGSDWPPDDLSLEQDLIDLGWHQKEFQKRTSFAYTVMSLDESKYLGCVYIYPSDNPAYDALVMMWFRDSEFEKGLDSKLFSVVKEWINQKWSFRSVAYPGRENKWEDC